MTIVPEVLQIDYVRRRTQDCILWPQLLPFENNNKRKAEEVRALPNNIPNLHFIRFNKYYKNISFALHESISDSILLC